MIAWIIRFEWFGDHAAVDNPIVAIVSGRKGRHMGSIAFSQDPQHSDTKSFISRVSPIAPFRPFL